MALNTEGAACVPAALLSWAPLPEAERELVRLRDFDFWGGDDRLFLSWIWVTSVRFDEGIEVRICPFNTVEVPPVTIMFTSLIKLFLLAASWLSLFPAKVAFSEFKVVELKLRLRLPVGIAIEMALLALFSAKPPILAVEFVLLVDKAGRGEEPERFRLADGPADPPRGRPSVTTLTNETCCRRDGWLSRCENI